ncbi:hypothetical protein DR046_21720 [Jannaschia formosa]|nr:hypothetical protein [Jannaschia formosa]TFL16101.1 hypothetical protein DR046_21720 [Jannaschia formosa]
MGDDSDRDVRFLATVLLTAPGPTILYQREELGLGQPRLPRAAMTDPLDLLHWSDGPGRENARVPIPWAEGRDQGFWIGRSWLPMDWPRGASVAVQDVGRDTNLTFYRRAAAFRRSRLRDRPLQGWSREGEVIRLMRQGATVVLNFGTGPVPADPDPAFASGEMGDGALPGRTAAVWLD